MKQKRYPKGHFVGLGIAIGIPLGIPIGLILGNIALGPAIGAAIGIPIGMAMEKKKNPNPRILTKKEEKIKKIKLTIVLGIGIVALLAIIIAYSIQ